MNLQKLAERLIESKSELERQHLLVEVSVIDSLQLAYTLRDINYEVWTIEPTKAQKTVRAIRSLLKSNPNSETEALAFWIAGISKDECTMTHIGSRR